MKTEILPPDITTTVKKDNFGEITRITHDVPKINADAATLEKAIEVNKIQATQELKRQLKEATATEQQILAQNSKDEQQVRKEIQDSHLAHVKGRADIKQLTKLLSSVLGLDSSPATLVEGVELAMPEGADRTDGIFASFNEGLTKVFLVTEYGIQVPDREGDYDNSENASVCEWVSLTAAQTFKIKKLKAAEESRIKQWNLIHDLEERLKGVNDQSDQLKAAVYRREIAKAEGGEQIIQLLDRSLEATIQGKYLALL